MVFVRPHPRQKSDIYYVIVRGNKRQDIFYAEQCEQPPIVVFILQLEAVRIEL
jgi:hypothetical protein